MVGSNWNHSTVYVLLYLPPSLLPSVPPSPESLSDAGEHDQLFLSDGLSLSGHQREPVSHMTSHDQSHDLILQAVLIEVQE